MPNLILSSAFVRDIKKLLKKNPQLKSKIDKTLKTLRHDPSHPSLRLHKLSGINNWSVSVSRDIRIIIHWDGKDFFLTRIGTHDDLY